MRIKARAVKTGEVMALLLVAMLMLSGCSVLKSKNEPTAGPGTPGASQAAQTKTVYLDFGDVLLPKELKVVKDSSFVFTTSGLTAGVLSLKGSVESNSLVTFFENRMPEDGWQMISAIKASSSMLLFKKQARWCVIGIDEGQMSTHVQIWVAPTIGAATSGLTK